MNNPFKRFFKIDSSIQKDDVRPTELAAMDLTAIDRWLTQVGGAVTAPPDFRAQLQEKLGATAKDRRSSASPRSPVSPRGFRFIWAAFGLVLVVLTITFALPLLQQHDTTDTLPTAPKAVSDDETETPDAVTEQAPLRRVLFAFLGESVQGQSRPEGLFAQAGLSLNAPFPESPTDASAYEQVFSTITSADEAKARAAELGIDGAVYTIGSEGGSSNYLVTDGVEAITFFQHARQFSYQADINSGVLSSPEPPPLETRAAIATAFLKERGLLDFDYQVDQALSQDNRVIFTPLLEGYPLWENSAHNPRIEVTVDGDGEVFSVTYRLNPLRSLGSYSLRSAREAWDIVLNNADDHRVLYEVVLPEMSVRQTQPVWLAAPPIGQQVEVYSYLDVYQPSEAEQAPLVTAGGFTLEGDLAGLLAAHENPPALTPDQRALITEGIISEKHAMGWNRFFHIWGDSSQAENGARTLQVTDWEVSPMPDLHLSGVFSKSDAGTVFVSKEGQQWHIADIPEAVPLNTQVSVRGVPLDLSQRTFRWSLIQIEPTSIYPSPSGGGGGGLLPFSPDPKATREPTPASDLMPYVGREKVEGLVGTLSVYKNLADDGSSQITASINTSVSYDAEATIAFQLLDDDLAALSDLNQLHLRVWGVYTLTEDGFPAIELQRYEKAYPQEKLQAWLGHQQVIELGGRSVLQFTDIDGRQYILHHALLVPETIKDTSLLSKDQIIVEGALSQETYHGLPVIRDLRIGLANDYDVTDLDDYVIHAGDIIEVPDYSASESFRSQDELMIDQIELVYYAYDLSHGGGGVPLDESPARFVQPVWRFSGALSDGRIVDILVQAVTDDYLK